jgi:hypothetical protein
MKPTKELAYPNLSFDIDIKNDLIDLRNLVSKYNIKINTNAIDIIKYKNQELKN